VDHERQEIHAKLFSFPREGVLFMKVPPIPTRFPTTPPGEKRLREICALSIPEALKAMGTTAYGLSEEEASARIEKFGPNELKKAKRLSFWEDIYERIKSPLVIQLMVIALVSGLIGELKSTFVVIAMILLSVGLSHLLDRRSVKAVEALGKRVQSRTVVIRDGKEVEIKVSEVVPGDIVALYAGSIVPADIRLIATKDLFISQAALSGESMAVEKFAEPIFLQEQVIWDLPNACFMGSNVTSGTAQGVVVNTGSETVFGSIAERLTQRRSETSFDLGVKSFTWLMIRFMVVMVGIVFFLVGVTKGNWIEALLFGLAVAVGLTPEMLPMIITVNLSKGALSMAKRKVIVKRLPAIQNLGAMDVLCTDKTGTLTEDRVVLERHVDITGNTSEDVLTYAFLNSYYQTGLRNLIDRAVIEAAETMHEHEQLSVVDELPFDFQRRRMSVVVNYEGAHVLICKGAVEEIYSCCSQYQIGDEVYPLIDMIRADLFEEVERLNQDGFRVLGIAYREFPQSKRIFTTADESDLILLGYMAFFDPPKVSATGVIRSLKEAGVRIKVLTGDNGLVTRKVCDEVELPCERMMSGVELAQLSREEISRVVEEVDVFIKLTPSQKEEIVHCLRQNGHVVGFLGDGINDAPALRAADVGISVDSAVDVAKEAADIVLLEKSLLVLEEGIKEGRRVFANIVKYIRMGASSNFGNMFSVLGASYLIPFLPMQPIQILTNNLLYDFSQTGIPTDRVDPEITARPLKCNIENIKRFMVWIGPISSIFDYATFALMWFFFGCSAYLSPDLGAAEKGALVKLFNTGWFVESLLTQTLIVHIIRTPKIPFLESRPSLPMAMATLTVMAIGIWLPYSPLAHTLGLVPLPFVYWFWVVGFLIAYGIITHKVKTWFFARYGGD